MPDLEGDPTADFLASVRPGDLPWRTDRSASSESRGGPDAEKLAERPGQYDWPGRRHTAARVVENVAPFVQAALFAAWIATWVADSNDWPTDQSG
jgi:hypothetical protein